MFEIVYDDDDGRTDGRRLDGYTISSPCEPNGSGELIILSIKIHTFEENNNNLVLRKKQFSIICTLILDSV